MKVRAYVDHISIKAGGSHRAAGLVGALSYGIEEIQAMLGKCPCCQLYLRERKE